jgi:hypothetical protein
LPALLSDIGGFPRTRKIKEVSDIRKLEHIAGRVFNDGVTLAEQASDRASKPANSFAATARRSMIACNNVRCATRLPASEPPLYVAVVGLDGRNSDKPIA